MYRLYVVAGATVLLGTVSPVAKAGSSNLTLYRITPRNYTGVTNLDTGDAAGDAFFGLYEKSEPIVCSSQAKGMSGLLCTNDPLLQIPGFNMYIQAVVEADDRFGEYSECNPSKEAPHEFECTHYGQPVCWNANPEHPEWAKEFAGVCDPKVCVCEAVEVQAVGKEHVNFGSQPPPGTPPMCDSNYFTLGNYSIVNQSTLINSTTSSLSDCCSQCTGANTEEVTVCSSYSFVPSKPGDTSNGTCELHNSSSFDGLQPGFAGAYTGFFDGLGLVAFVQKASGTLSDMMDGYWFSTQAAGQCNKSTDVIGKDCWWRLVEQTAQVNASCVNDAMISKVLAQRPDCTKACPQPTNQSSDCFIGCLFETLVGNKSATPVVPATPRQLIIDAFEDAFKPGACPTVPDCPDPCLPPCWAVPGGDPCDPSQ